MIITSYERMPSDEIERRVRDLDFYASTSLRSPPPANDPIFTPLFTAILGAGGFGLTGAALSTGVAISTAIATTPLTVGIQRLP